MTLLSTLLACCVGDRKATAPSSSDITPHSFSRPDRVRVRHLELDLTVDFEQRQLAGRASLYLDNLAGSRELSLDTRDLDIQRVTLDDAGEETSFLKGLTVEYLGEPLTIEIEPDTRVVHIDYRTSPSAPALQWLDPEQTAGRIHPFLLSQSQAVLARSWVPCQDTPAVRMTYSAHLQVPPGLLALMSASNPTEVNDSGVYEFEMPQPIPSYLLAVAVGDLGFRPLSTRTGVYAEKPVLEAAAWELADTEAMVRAAEDLYGPYAWDRYDLIVLPPSFPFGGMENPRLTFLTPTVLAGDRSLVALIAHELAHSWSGNLVTNRTWNDFWLNEGFTTYFEHRIMEKVYGGATEKMLAVLELEALEKSLETDFKDRPRDTWLYQNLQGRDPDDSMTPIAYDKGNFFLRLLEESVGRERWDAFLRGYFKEFAFQSIDSATFVEYLRSQLLKGDPALQQRLQIESWIYGPWLPSNCPRPESAELEKIKGRLEAWRRGASAQSLRQEKWTTFTLLYFLRHQPQDLPLSRVAELDQAFGFTRTGNSEILFEWLMLSLRTGYSASEPALEDFLTRQGRRKFVLPLYKQMAQTEAGRQRALKIYQKARSSYHSVTRESVDKVLLGTTSEASD